jgi:general secretion pathway protein M
MIAALGQRRTCILALSALVLIPLAAVALITVSWLQAMNRLDDAIDADLDRLARYQRLVATLPGLRAALEEEKADDSYKAFYFDAETPTIAGAQLQSEVQEMVRAAGARPVSTQILPGDENEDPPRVRVRIQLQGTTDQLFDVLYRVESARPFLLIDQLSVRSQARSDRRFVRRSVRRPQQPDDQDQLTVRLDIFGYFLSPAG